MSIGEASDVAQRLLSSIRICWIGAASCASVANLAPEFEAQTGTNSDTGNPNPSQRAPRRPSLARSLVLDSNPFRCRKSPCSVRFSRCPSLAFAPTALEACWLDTSCQLAGLSASSPHCTTTLILNPRELGGSISTETIKRKHFKLIECAAIRPTSESSLPLA